jgi:hypothetical protein
MSGFDKFETATLLYIDLENHGYRWNLKFPSNRKFAKFRSEPQFYRTHISPDFSLKNLMMCKQTSNLSISNNEPGLRVINKSK